MTEFKQGNISGERKDFYVYMYLDPDGVPVYVGKGSGRRFRLRDHIQKRSPRFLRNKILKIGVENVKTHFLHKDLFESGAFHWEKYWIKYIGRRDRGLGTLCNVSDGGEGPSGHKFSPEHCRKISVARIGVPLSDDHRKSLSIARSKVKDTQDTIRKRADGMRRWWSLGDHRLKMSKRMLGNCWCVGLRRSDEVKKRMSDAQKLRYEKARNV